MNELLPIDDGVPKAMPSRTRRHDVKVPADNDRIEADDAPSAMLGEIARQVETLMLADLKYVNGFLEPDDDPSLSETVQLSQHVTLPVLDDREPQSVPMVAPGPPPPIRTIGRPATTPCSLPLAPSVPPLFAPGGTPPGPAELRQALRELAEELIDHGRTMIDLSLRDEEPAGYVAGVLAYRENDVTGVAMRLGMLGRLFARLGVGNGPKGA